MIAPPAAVTAPEDIESVVRQALAEDIGGGDLTAALIPADRTAEAVVTCREPAVICGAPWVDEVFGLLDKRVVIEWRVRDGDEVAARATVCTLRGPARALVTGERTALNFLQTLSGTATATHGYVRALADTGVILLDTRKTVPGLRAAQKYAVRCGQGHNHRSGLFDGILIKENHIVAAGSVGAAVAAMHAAHPGRPVEIEVEDLVELGQALAAGADILLLDNFSLEDMREAVSLTAGAAKLEASGGFDIRTVRAVAETGVDYVSVGALTKHLRAIDFSMRFNN